MNSCSNREDSHFKNTKSRRLEEEDLLLLLAQRPAMELVKAKERDFRYC